MRDIQKEIQDSLDAVEKEYGVEILLAAEAGSRAWGFASDDSDYDVRFIYVMKPEEYLRIDMVRDVIEYRLDEVLDISGWDIRKVLAALGKGNPNVMEWINSPVIYRKSDKWEQLNALMESYFSRKASIYHYYGTANSTYKGHLCGDTVRYKKYFYALRPLLCCRWIERYDSIPPVLFSELLQLFDGTDEVLDAVLYANIQELLKRKALTGEKEENPHMPVIIDFIREELAGQKRIVSSMEDDRRHDWTELNEAFRKIVRTV
ncbi:MAG: nucleotidyltransferase domain-containing protein [Solobacterium sp.]|nr:nucleotidyltransferase domain-containing protein [Solobacterium sp.]